MSKLLNVSSSPHVRSHETTHSIMLDVAIAMLPASAFGVYHFGLHALLVLIVTVAACMLSEYLYEKLMKKPNTLYDCSALVTGMILALNMPPEIPVWIPALGGVFAIIVVKQLYGGLGQNFMNPALAARCFLLISFAGKMTNFSYSGFDGISGATPLAVLKSGGTVDIPAMFVGNIPGTIGEVSVIALLAGAAYLLVKKVISIRIPAAYILTVVVFAALFWGTWIGCELYPGPSVRRRTYLWRVLYGHRLCDQPDYAKGADCIRYPFRRAHRTVPYFSGGSAEGVSYAIIISNILVPLIES